MRTKRDIYCEYNFWEAFFILESKIIHNRSKRRLWDAFYEFLSNNNLFFDVHPQKVNNLTPGGSNLNEIRIKKGGAGIKFIPNSFPKIDKITDKDDNLLNSVFLTLKETLVCKQLSERFGIIVFNLELIFSANHVFFDNGITLSNTNGQNWSFLWVLKEKYPSICCCNSLIVADRYLLEEKENIIDANLRPIFDSLLPQQLENGITFTIYIVAENKSTNINDKLSELKNLILELRPNLCFSISIFHSWILHDRSILTNNIILTSGVGFDVIDMDERARRFTTTSLRFPFLQYDAKDNCAYLDWISNVIEVEKRCRSFNSNYWGERTHRHHLLDCYCEKPERQRFPPSFRVRFS